MRRARTAVDPPGGAVRPVLACLRAGAIASALCVGLGAVLVACGAEETRPDGAAAQSFPPPPGNRPVSGVAPEDFVGSESCAECHAAQFGPWSASTHGRAGGLPEPAVVVAPFDGTPIRFADGVVIPRVQGG